jgi:hypothetical protein
LALGKVLRFRAGVEALVAVDLAVVEVEVEVEVEGDEDDDVDAGA